MDEIKPKFLPIGTVVMLKNGKKRVMITGFCLMTERNEEGKGKYWDYGGCLYPEGSLDSTPEYIFNHNQIEKVYHMGLEEDEEEKEFKNKLGEVIEDLEKKNKVELAEITPIEQPQNEENLDTEVNHENHEE